MMPNVSIFGYLFVIILAILGFLFLAITRKRESEILLNRIVLEKEKMLFKTFAWSFLVVTFFVCVYLWTFSYGIFLYLAVLILASLLVIVFIGFKAYKKEKNNFENISSKEKNESLEKFRFAKIVGIIALVLLPLGVAYSLFTLPKYPLQSENAIKDKIGEFEFVLAEHISGKGFVTIQGMPMQTFHLRFCQDCDLKIKYAYLRINKPRNLSNAGIVFDSPYWDRTSTIQLNNLNDKSELWLTVVSSNGEVYQKSWSVKETFPKTLEWLEKYKMENMK
ncbi:DUF3325 family protein [Aliarcobacter butzleri]|uniref:DUF3325 family protein n=1 Tax=Aliarcobacter butzleri TaxID=28197 RepID=A0AAW7PS03_9BACT|nr:DUF3325 family protein [Aliarcobacter butzleri]MDN5063605.1 DUF3325 family protein [Aliarcobacter butzleri]MDN5067101.1 DUF3325 family protein [Aliarcobacter butzleri]